MDNIENKKIEKSLADLVDKKHHIHYYLEIHHSRLQSNFLLSFVRQEEQFIAFSPLLARKIKTILQWTKQHHLCNRVYNISTIKLYAYFYL